MADELPPRSESLKFAIAFALRKVRLARDMTEETRYRIAGEAVDSLVRGGRWPELNDRPELRQLSDGRNVKWSPVK